jgi:intein/homing endonuclease
MAKKIDRETINIIIKLYQSGLSSIKIAALLNSKSQTITKYLKISGIEIRGPITKLSEIQKSKILELYKNGISSTKIAETFNVNNATILKFLKKEKVLIRSAEEAHRKYQINEDFFDKIDSEEKAYFIGLLYADGCNHKSSNYVSLGLNERDKVLLVKLSSLIYKDDSLNKIKSQDRTEQNKGVINLLTINSKYICNKLDELGCVQAKTFKIKYPEWLHESLHRHFIRGYFDGDGCIYVNRKIGRSSYVKTTSNLDFANGIKKIIEKYIDINVGIYLSAKKSRVYDARISGNRQCKKILDWLYFDSKIFMKRKYDKYLKLLENINELIENGTPGYSKRYLKK